MFWTYILKSEKDERYYIGQTKNIEDRIFRHNTGQEKYTKKYMPWKLVFKKAFNSRGEAMAFERKLKRSKSRSYIEKWIEGEI